MPPKPKFTREEIVQTALEIVSQKGVEALTAKELGDAVSFDDVFGELGPTAGTCIGLIREEYDMSEAEARLLFENIRIFTFGVGALCATRMCHFSEAKLGEMLSTEFQAMMLLVRSRAGDAQ